MHDAIIAERLGLPAVGIITEQFVTAAQLMARALGAIEYGFIEIAHPISSASGEALAERARTAAAASTGILLAKT